jgi:hypothetical protein
MPMTRNEIVGFLEANQKSTGLAVARSSKLIDVQSAVASIMSNQIIIMEALQMVLKDGGGANQGGYKS